MVYLQFTETPRFEKRASKLIGEDEVARLQLHLCEFPEFGDVIQNSGGLRKMRWASSGRGKRGGSRIIYYLVLSRGRILLLDIYPKNERSDLSSSELVDLKRDVEIWRKQL